MPYSATHSRKQKGLCGGLHFLDTLAAGQEPR